jgi:hypothetical protein
MAERLGIGRIDHPGPRLSTGNGRHRPDLNEMDLAMTLTTRLTAFAVIGLALCGPSHAQSRRPPASNAAAEAQIKQRLNTWAIGLAGGLLEGAPIRLATDIARVVNDGGVMHVLPIVTRGPT